MFYSLIVKIILKVINKVVVVYLVYFLKLLCVKHVFIKFKVKNNVKTFPCYNKYTIKLWCLTLYTGLCTEIGAFWNSY